MIQFNLLPDVKLDYVKTRRTKRTVTSIALITSAATLGILILLFMVVNLAQRNHLTNLSEDIAKYSKELEDTPGLDKVLTVQNQLNRLTELHDKKPVATRLAKYLAQITPTEVTIAEIEVDFSASTITIKGGAASLKDINKFADTLKFTDFKTKSERKGKAFSDVVLKSFGTNEDGQSYELGLKFDKSIFSSEEEIELIVPATTTTRSVVENPGPLFKPLENLQGTSQ